MRKNNLKKVGILTLAISLFATTSLVFADEIPCKECKNKPMTVATTVDTKSHYKDMSDTHWANKYVNYCASKGMIDGYPDGTFRPNEMVGMEEFVKMVVAYKYGNLPAQKGEKWYMPYVNKGVETKILIETDNEQNYELKYLRCPCFDPSNSETNMSKVGAMQIINNMLNLDGDTAIISKVNNNDMARKIAETFKNSREIMDWGENPRIESMQVVASGIISGNEKKELIVGDFTRAECAAILARYADKDLRKPYIKDVDTLSKADYVNGHKVLKRGKFADLGVTKDQYRADIKNSPFFHYSDEYILLDKADFIEKAIVSKVPNENDYFLFIGDKATILNDGTVEDMSITFKTMDKAKYLILFDDNYNLIIENPAKEVFTKFGLIK